MGIQSREGRKNVISAAGSRTSSLLSHALSRGIPLLSHANTQNFSGQFFGSRVLLLKACNTNKPTIVALMDGYSFHCFSCCWYNRSETIEYSMNRWGGGRGGGLLVMAGGGLWVGMAVTDARLVSARLAQAGRSRDREQRGERSDPVPGCILPSSNQRAKSGWLTLPLAIPITQSLLLCFQPWFMCYLLTLHSILDDRETGGSEKTVTPEFHYRDTWLHWETIKCGLSKSSTK